MSGDGSHASHYRGLGEYVPAKNTRGDGSASARVDEKQWSSKWEADAVLAAGLSQMLKENLKS